MRIQIKRLTDTAKLPTYATDGSGAMDVYADEDVWIPPTERRLVKTSIAIAVPRGYVASIRPRSGLALKDGLLIANSPGTVDSDYRGPVGIILWNTDSNSEFVVSKGDRVAQMIIERAFECEWEEVEELDVTDRGSSGFGSTGR